MNLPIETQLKLKRFKPREYQWPLIDAIEKEGYKRVLAVMPRRCLSGDTHITMADGSWKFLKDIKKGDKVLSWDGYRFVSDTVVKQWSTGMKSTKIVRSSKYLPLVSSDNHQFATTTSSSTRVRWQELKDIGKNRSLMQYAGRKLPFHIENDSEKAEFWGYMIADGYVVGYQQPKFTNTNMTILKRVEHLAKGLFRINPIWRKKGNGYDLGMTNGTKGGGMFTNPVKELFRSYKCDVPKSVQRLPHCVWEWSEESILKFFSALISADGNIFIHSRGFTASDTKHKIPPSVEITLNCGPSYNYAWDIYWLLRKIGIIPHTPYLEKGSNWKIKVGKSAYVKKLLSNRIYGKEEEQEQALDLIKNYTKETSVFKGCYRSGFKVKEGEDEELFDIETKVNHNFVANGYLVHNSGKDICAIQLALRQALRKVCVVYYIFPTFAQGRRVVFDNITNEGMRVLDYIPKELISSINMQMMKVTFVNGSILQVVGSDRVDALMGTNPYMCIFSEYSLQDPKAWSFIRPILAANDGTAIFLSTPRGRSNHLYYLYEIAKESPTWKCIYLTLDDTQHITDEQMAEERKEMSESLINQEYYCSWDQGSEHLLYGRYMDKMRLESRINDVIWEPDFPVHVAYDIGVRDPTTLIFWQNIGNSIRIIDCYDNNKVGLDHYAKILHEKPYVYGKHVAPHDIKVKEFGTGMTRLEKGRQLGIRFIVAPNIAIYDGIEAVRSLLPRVWIDQNKCTKLIKALENYREEYDDRKKTYKHIVHDWSSHWADSLRYLALGLPKTKSGSSTKEELDRRYYQAMYGGDHHLPAPFRKP